MGYNVLPQNIDFMEEDNKQLDNVKIKSRATFAVITTNMAIKNLMAD